MGSRCWTVIKSETVALETRPHIAVHRPGKRDKRKCRCSVEKTEPYRLYRGAAQHVQTTMYALNRNYRV